MRRIPTLCALLLSIVSLDAAAQAWRYVAPMATERRMHTATDLGNGRVLVAGGTNREHEALYDCEIYDLGTGLWTGATRMAVPRERHTATLLGDGRVVVIGGNSESNRSNRVTASIEIYDPARNQWSSGGALLTARQNHTATMLPDGTILVTGGYSESRGFLDECEIYDPTTMTSSATASLPRERMDHQALLLNDGRVLVLGGRVGGSNGEYLTRADVYTPSTGAWSSFDPMTESRITGFSLAQFSDSTVLVAGGRKGPEETTAGSELFNPRTSDWSTSDTMRLPVTWQGGAMLAHDRYLITGGFTDAQWQSPNDVRATATCEWYDRTAREWYFAPEMNQARAQHTMVYLRGSFGDGEYQEIVMVMGGIIGRESITNTVEILDVDEDALAQYARGQQSGSRDELSSLRNEGLSVIGNGSASPTIVVATAAAEPVRAELFASTGVQVSTLADRIGDGREIQLTLPRGLPSGAYFVRVMRGHAVGTTSISLVR